MHQNASASIRLVRLCESVLCSHLTLATARVLFEYEDVHGHHRGPRFQLHVARRGRVHEFPPSPSTLVRRADELMLLQRDPRGTSWFEQQAVCVVARVPIPYAAAHSRDAQVPIVVLVTICCALWNREAELVPIHTE